MGKHFWNWLKRNTTKKSQRSYRTSFLQLEQLENRLTPSNNLVVTVVAPPTLTPTGSAIVNVEYKNTGATSMPAPVLQLTASQDGTLGALLTLDPSFKNESFNTSTTPAGFSQTVQILAQGTMAGVLGSGESAEVAVYYGGWLSTEWNAANPAVAFSVGILTADNTSSINWPAMETAMQPAGIPTAAWQAIFSNLTAQLGSTWGQYVQRLDGDAAYLASLGANYTDVNQLFGLEMQEANGYGPVQTLSGFTDISVPVPGLSLSLGRSFSSSILGRYVPGPFGNGWALGGGWGQTLAIQGDGSVVVTQTNGSQLLFNQAPGGGLTPPPGDYDTLSDLGSGTFTLTSLNGQVTEFVNGQVAYIQDAHGNRITAGYSSGLLTSLADSSGAWLHLSYNGAGRLIGISNSLGQSASYAYDASNQHLLSARNYQGYTATYSYDMSSGSPAANALLSVTNAGGTVQNFSYDGEGRLAQTALGGAQSIRYTYAGGTVSAMNADGDTTTYNYEENGLLGQVVNALGHKTAYAYDKNGNLLSVTGPAGNISSYQYNSLGQMTQSTNADGAVTQFSFGSLNTLTSVTDPDGNTTKYQYDRNGDLLGTLYADNTLEQNAYNPIGELTGSKDGDGNVVDYTYNAAGQVLSKTYSDGSKVRYTYNGLGNLASVTDPTGTTTLIYNAADLLTVVLYPNGTYLHYSYNGAGQRTQMVDQTGCTVNYHYTAQGQLAGLTDGSGNAIVTYSYDMAGRLVKTFNGNHTYTTYTYNANGDVLSVINSAPNGSLNSSFVYTYDSADLCSSETTIDGIWTYGYDPAGQLTLAKFVPNSTDPDRLTAQNVRYFYDPAGNRTNTIINGVTTTYTINARNEYTQVGNTAYRYDGNGSLISKTSAGITTNFSYNANNQLIGISTPGGSSIIYQYNAFGTLYRQIQSGVTTNYLFDPVTGNPTGQFTNTGSKVAQYTYGHGLVSQITPAGTSFFYDFEDLGSTAGLSNPSGSYVNTYSYLPFGGLLTSKTAMPNPFQFVGQWGVLNQNNATTSLMGARFFDPSLGRFFSQDPLGLNGGQTGLYTYVGNNPVKYSDPTGRSFFLPPFVLAADATLETVVVPATLAYIANNPEVAGSATSIVTGLLGDTGLLPNSLGNFSGSFLSTIAQGKNPFEYSPSLSDISIRNLDPFVPGKVKQRPRDEGCKNPSLTHPYSMRSHQTRSRTLVASNSELRR